MEKSKRLEIKVGLFVAVGLVLAAALMLQFSHSANLLRGSYRLRLHTTNVGDIKPGASVLLAGVEIGSVAYSELATNSKSVTIMLTIYKEYQIYHDAKFVIEKAGFLGDAYVSIIPTTNAPPILANNADVSCEKPFDFQEAEESANDLLARLNDIAKQLDNTVADVRRTVLNEPTLASFQQTITNLHLVSEHAVSAIAGVDNLVATNQDSVGLAVSNLVFFSRKLDGLANSANGLLLTNGDQLTIATKNLAASSEDLKDVLNNVKAGNGLAGAILQNPQLASNVEAIAYNLAVTSSNLNRHGIWGILWSHKPPPETNAAAANQR